MSSHEQKKDVEMSIEDSVVKINSDSIESVRGTGCEVADSPDRSVDSNTVDINTDVEKINAKSKAIEKANTPKVTGDAETVTAMAIEEANTSTMTATTTATTINLAHPNAVAEKSDDTALKRPYSEDSNSSAAKRPAVTLDEKPTPPPRNSYLPESLRKDRVPFTHCQVARQVAMVQFHTGNRKPVYRLIQLSQHKFGKPIPTYGKLIQTGFTEDDLCDDLACDLHDYIQALQSGNPEAEQFADEMEESAKALGITKRDDFYGFVDLKEGDPVPITIEEYLYLPRKKVIEKFKAMDSEHIETFMRIIQLYELKHGRRVNSLITMKEVGVDYMKLEEPLFDEIFDYFIALRSKKERAEVLLKNINNSVRKFGFEKFDKTRGFMDLDNGGGTAPEETARNTPAPFDEVEYVKSLCRTVAERFQKIDSKHDDTFMRIIQLYEFNEGRSFYSLITMKKMKTENCRKMDYALVEELLSFLNAVDDGSAETKIKEVNDNVKILGFKEFDAIPGYMDFGIEVDPATTTALKKADRKLDVNKNEQLTTSAGLEKDESTKSSRDEYFKMLRDLLIEKLNKMGPKHNDTILRIAQIHEYDKGRPVNSLITMKKTGVDCAKIDNDLVVQILSYLNALEMDETCAEILLQDIHDAVRTYGFENFDENPGPIVFGSKAGSSTASAPSVTFAGKTVKIDELYTFDAEGNLVSAFPELCDNDDTKESSSK